MHHKIPTFYLEYLSDTNDNSPQCKVNNSTVKVPENSEVPRVLTTIECTDLDEGPYGQVREYNILHLFTNISICTILLLISN